MKRTIVLNILMICLLVLAGVVVSKNDLRNYQTLMDRGNIREDALIFPSRSRQSIPTVLRKFEQKNVQHYQINFIQKKNPNLSYVYMSHNVKTLPMTNGRFFSASDFQSPIPFVVLGRDLGKKTYKPQYQAYYQLNHNYYSVIGYTGLSNTTKLNQHIFISTSPQQHNHTQIRHYQIVIDGQLLNHPQKLKKVQAILHASYPYRSANQINNIKQSWWQRWGWTLLILSGIAFLVLFLSFFVQIPAVQLLKRSLLNGDLLLDFQFGNWLKFVITEIVTFGVALIIIFAKIQIVSWKYFMLYLIFLFIAVILLAAFQLLINHKNKNEALHGK